jgi:hypothetical protein
MNVLRLVLAVAAFVGLVPPSVSAGQARFWISDSDENPNGSVVPIINGPVGRERTLYIWAQPDPGRKLQHFSLNLVAAADADEMVVDFLNPRIEVYNPNVQVDAQTWQSRFEYVHDSHSLRPLVSNATCEQVLDDQPDGIGGRDASGDLRDGYDIEGFSLNFNSHAGIGHPNDPLRYLASNDRYAWLVARVGFQSLLEAGSDSFHLQIGYYGITDTDVNGGNNSHTQVVFGNTDDPAYDSGRICGEDPPHYCERQYTEDTDTYDVRVIAAASQPGDYNGSGAVGAEDYDVWTSQFSQSVCCGTGADGNGDGAVDAADYVFWRNLAQPESGDFNLDGYVDAADYALWRSGLGTTYTQNDYHSWRAQFGETPGQASPRAASRVPEPACVALALLVLSTIVTCAGRRGCLANGNFASG